MSDRLDEAREQLAEMRAQRAAEPTLFDDDDADDAISSVAANAGDEWKRRALEAVRSAAMHNTTITVLDAWSRCRDCETPDRRAIGWAMRRASQLGWIVSTGTYKPSSVPAHHGRPTLIWRSTITDFDDGTSFDLRRTDEPRRGGAA